MEPEGDQLVFKSSATLTDERRRRADARGQAARPCWSRRFRRRATGSSCWSTRRCIEGRSAGEARSTAWRRSCGSSCAPRRRRRDANAAPRKRARQLENLKRFALPVIEALARCPAARSGAPGARPEALAGRALRDPERVLRCWPSSGPWTTSGRWRSTRCAGCSKTACLPAHRAAAGAYGTVFVARWPRRAAAPSTRSSCRAWPRAFPRRATEDPLLLDDHRARSRGSHASPSADADRSAWRASACCCASRRAPRRRLVVSYPNLDPSQGRPGCRRSTPSTCCAPPRAAARPAAPRGAGGGLVVAPRLAGTARRTEAIDDAEFDLSTLLDCSPRPRTRSRPRPLPARGQRPLRRSLRHATAAGTAQVDARRRPGAPRRRDDACARPRRHAWTARATPPPRCRTTPPARCASCYQAVLRLRPRDRPERWSSSIP